MNNLTGVLAIRKMNKVMNTQKRELYGVTKGVNARIDESVFQWFGHAERMERYE